MKVFMKKMTNSFVLLLTMAAFPLWAAEAEAPTQTNAAPAKSPAKGADLFADSIVAKGKGFEITRNQMDTEVINRKAAYAARGGNLTADDAARLEKQVLND